MMDLWASRSCGPGPSGNPKAPNAANYDESKANRTPPAGPAGPEERQEGHDRRAVGRSAAPEIVEDFDREIYGRMPARTPRELGGHQHTDEVVGDVPVVTKQLVGHVDNSSYPPITVDIQLTLTTPADATGPVPVIMEFGFGLRGPAGAPPRPSSARPDAGRSRSSPRAGATRSSSPTASRPTTARA